MDPSPSTEMGPDDSLNEPPAWAASRDLADVLRSSPTVDLPNVAAAVLQEFGSLVVEVAQRLASTACEVAQRLDGSFLLDFAADLVDRGLVWAGSPDGQRALEATDLALIGVRVADFYGQTGVYRPLAPVFVRDALERSAYHGPHDPRALLAEVAPGSDNWCWVTEGLLNSPSLWSRRELLEDGIRSIEAGLYGPAVTCLLPLFEGVISDKSGVLDHMRVGLRLDRILARECSVAPDGIGDLLTRPALRIVDAEIFARREFDEVQIGDPTLNRHLILHGRTVAYRTREHALRTLMLVAALAEALDGPLYLSAMATQPADDPGLIDEFGYLAPVRSAALVRVETGQPLWRKDRVLARRGEGGLPPGRQP